MAPRKESMASAGNKRTGGRRYPRGMAGGAGRELATLNAIAEALNSTADVRQALERMLALVADLLGLRTGWVWLLDRETDQFYLAAARDLPPYLQEPVRMSGHWCVCTDLFRRGTDPVFAVVRRLVPRFVGDRHIPWLSLVLLFALRLPLLPLLRDWG